MADSNGFVLHERLAADTVRLGSLPLCEVLLMNDAQYPWLILVPRQKDIREIHQLAEADQQQLMRESVLVAARMQQHFSADKMNVAALGNMVPQLHIHHIARFAGDVAWPMPVWGMFPARAYTAEELELMVAGLRQLFAGQLELT